MFVSQAVPSLAMPGARLLSLYTTCLSTSRAYLNAHLRVQVADALSDSGVDDWVAMLADKAAATSWSEPKQASPVLRVLWQLPSHLLHRVLTEYLAKCDLEHLLFSLPRVLHPSVVSTAAASGHVTLSPTHFDATLSLLASCPTSSPGLLSLTFPEKLPTGSINVADSCALLAHTLSHHASLTSLSLSPVLLPAEAVLELSRGLVSGALNNLVSLMLSVEVHPDGCAAVAGCLKSLTALTKLQVTLYFNKSPSSAVPDLTSFVQAASSPADLSSLKELVLMERHCKKSRSLRPTSQSSMHLLPPLISAPNLTHVELYSDVAGGSFARLLDSLSHFTAVHTLGVTTAMFDRPAAPRHSSSKRSAGSSQVGCYMPALQGVFVTGGCHIVQLTMAAAIAARSSSALTSLALHQRHSDDLAGCDLCNDKQQRAWKKFVRVLRLCGGLRSLELSSLCSSAGADEPCQSHALMGALQQLPLLTHLSLTARCRQCALPIAPIPLRGDLLGVALRGVTGLRSLAVVGAADELAVTGQEALLTALPVLQQLTSLCLCFAGVQQAHLVDLMPKLPAIKQCKLLPGVAGRSEEAIAAFRARFPDVTFAVCSSSA